MCTYGLTTIIGERENGWHGPRGQVRVFNPPPPETLVARLLPEERIKLPRDVLKYAVKTTEQCLTGTRSLSWPKHILTFNLDRSSRLHAPADEGGTRIKRGQEKEKVSGTRKQ